MLLSTIFLSLFISLRSLTSAAPTTPPNVPPSIATALAAGVDPYGPIPDDYTSYVNGTYHFEAHTATSLWVRAQGDLPPPSEVQPQRRGLAGIGLGGFEDEACALGGGWTDDIVMGDQYMSNDHQQYHSYVIRTRDMAPGEQLDFSYKATDAHGNINDCATFAFLVRGQKKGCHKAEKAFTCMHFWHN